MLRITFSIFTPILVKKIIEHVTMDNLYHYIMHIVQCLCLIY
jgi:hypothetical protein